MPSSRGRLAGLLLAAAIALPGPARAQQPAPGRVEVVPIASRTLSGEEFLAGQREGGKPTLLAGELRLPFPLPPGRKVPAVVLVHGSGGSGASTDLWARELNAAGLGAFILDSFAGRGITSTVQDQSQLHSLAMMVDAYRALDWLAEHPRIRADRIAVMGFSKGAVAAVYSAMTRFQSAFGNPAHRFAAHIGLYTPCNIAYAKDAEVGPAPIRLFHGVVDDYVAIAPCRDYAARLKQAGADVSLTEYANGQHSFDNPFQPLLVTVADAQTTRGCRLEEGPGGAMLNAETKRPYTLADACVARGAHVGYDPVGAAAVRAAVRAFAEERLLK
ncbi:dienelactone hydrolase family protein [Paracraurococcus lichenis]|uniref:Dienelactone hydrolase family protein n=1 Tax=Paracraurococcus lichenis TaxID=3064888 RepID=A0ABT9E5E2_9PROT|nr:dienelactone hydrolase family protein [Paracraurococcus sp. LOR1-02]MDO9711384.1 dienelactone hydrolase family protein [Paracraurococcus sp. LOR1-02]